MLLTYVAAGQPDNKHIRNVEGLQATYITEQQLTHGTGGGTPPVGGGGGGGAVGGGGGGGGSGPSPSLVDFEWTVKHDIEALAAANQQATGIFSDGVTLWITDNAPGAGDAVYAYDLATGERVTEREIVLAPGNRAPRGIWVSGGVVWISDSGRDRIFAYDLETGRHLPQRDIALDRRNGNARGIWGGNGVIWVLGSFFAYDLETGALLAEYALDPANRDPRGAWSDGVTLWVSDHGAKQLFAYRLPEPPATPPDEPIALERVREEEFTNLSSSSNNSPRGIWSDGEVMYVADAADGRVYTYNMPDSIDARLASLTLEGVEIGEFDAARTTYDGVPGEGVTETTVTAAAAQRRTTVVIEPPDADERAPGHQVALGDIDEITVTVTSADGSRTRVYRVALEVVEEPWAHSLKGAVSAGFSFVVYEGGTVEALADAAESRGLAALYVLHEGRYVAYFPEAPDFVNRPFAELFADGVPALTPLVAASAGPPSDDPVGDVRAPRGWPGCLRGEVGAGFSAMVFAGGAIGELVACVRSLGVTAVYVLADGEWVSYIPGALDSENRPFVDLFPDGLPPLTPLVVEGASPVPAEVERAARQLLAGELDADEGDLKLESSERVEWSDASLGCPREDEAYAQVITPGYRLVFAVAGTSHAVHTNADGSRLVTCGEGE